MDTLLEAIGIVLETHFGFGFPNGSPIGDSLSFFKSPRFLAPHLYYYIVLGSVPVRCYGIANIFYLKYTDHTIR